MQKYNTWSEKGRKFISNPFFSIALFLIISVTELYLPGLYMDSVNPDYFAAYISNPGKVPIWAYPDNVLFPDHKFPLLNSLYGGATPAYIGLMVWRITGYNVLTLRLLHLLYGVILILLSYKTIKWITKNCLLASIIAITISLDATFIFSWRTQYYLQLFPLITYLPSLCLLSKLIFDYNKTKQFSLKLLMISGLFAGFSAWGYFIYTLYFVSSLCILVYYTVQRKMNWKAISTYFLSFIVGYIVFIYAHISIILSSGVHGYLEYLRSMNSSYGISQQLHVDLFGRILHVWDLVTSIFGGGFVAKVMLGNIPFSFSFGEIIFIMWFFIMILYLFLKIYNKKSIDTDTEQRILIFTKLTFAVVLIHLLFGVIIGPSLNFQHYIMLLPIIYLSGGGALYGIYLITNHFVMEHLTHFKLFEFGKMVVGLFWILLILNYTNNNSKIFNVLSETGGIGYYSDSINRLADYTYETPNDAVFAFPQWGYWMGVATATGGAREIWSENNIEELIKEINNRPTKKDYFVVLEKNQLVEAKTTIPLKNKLVLVNTITFHTRNGLPTFYVAHFERKDYKNF